MNKEELEKKELAEKRKERKESIEKRKAIIKKIKIQVGNTAEESLMFAIVETAIVDACLPVLKTYNKKAEKYYDPNESRRKSGLAYLRTEMPHAVIIGLEPQWIRDMIVKIGVLK